MSQINEAGQGQFTIAQHVKYLGKDHIMDIGILRLNRRTANVVHCELLKTPKTPSSAFSCGCSTLAVLVLSAQTQTPSLSLCHRFRSYKKGLSLLTKSFVATHICSEQRSQHFLLTYNNAAFRITASVSFSLTCVEI